MFYSLPIFMVNKGCEGFSSKYPEKAAGIYDQAIKDLFKSRCL
jgi:hypothetical protein